MITAVWMRLRVDSRARWRTWLGLALLVGLVGGIAIAAAAGARRTESAYPRFFQSHDGYDVGFGGTAESRDIGAESAAIAALPQVSAAVQTNLVSGSATLPDDRQIGFPEFVAVADATGRDGYKVNRWKILSGRAPDPGRADEGVIGFPVHDQLGVNVGDVIRVHIGDPSADPATMPTAAVRVVGIVVGPGGLPIVGSVSIGPMELTPAFARQYSNQLPPDSDGPNVLLKDRRDLPAFLSAVAKIDPAIDIPTRLPEHLAGVRRTLRFEVLALWALCGLTALAGVGVVGQALARQVYLGADENPTLRSLGMSRRQLVGYSAVAAVAIGLVGAAVAAGVAYVASWFTPIGLARVAEPNPGFAFDAFVYLVGAAATVVGVLISSSLPAWRAAGRVERTDVHRASKGHRAAAALPISATTGIRMALTAGRRDDAVPVRSAVLGSTIGIGALVTALVFGTSLNHLIKSPELSGYTWDTTIISQRGPAGALPDALAADPDVAASTRGGIGGVIIGGKPLQALVYETAKPIRPAMVEGRAPDHPGEIALGASTMRAVHGKIGGTVDVYRPPDPDAETPAKTPPARMRIVGKVVIPPFFFQSGQPGEGVAMTLEGLSQFDPKQSGSEGSPSLVRFRPGVDLYRKLAQYKSRFPDLFTINKRAPGAELLSLQRVSGLPMALAGLLATLALGTLAHALLTSIRRRRRDIAILKTLGFVGRQVRGSIQWQSLTLTALALVVGVPAGVAAGRWLWLLFAGDIGVVPRAVVPPAAATVAPAAVVIAALIAALPARAAARTQPAVELRTE